MSLENDTHLYDRIGKKRRKHLMMSAELATVLDSALPPGEASAYVERAVWSQLIEDYGREAVRDEIENAQDDLDTDDQLAEERPYALEA